MLDWIIEIAHVWNPLLHQARAHLVGAVGEGEWAGARIVDSDKWDSGAFFRRQTYHLCFSFRFLFSFFLSLFSCFRFLRFLFR